MNLEAELILLGCALAVTIPLMVMVLRRIIRGERFDKPEPGDMPMPPPGGPSVDAGS